MSPKISDIINLLEEVAPVEWQEDFDNSGWQILLPGKLKQECSGCIICIDVTPDIIKEASQKKCNLIITHHPLLFKGIKRIEAQDRIGSCIIQAIKSDISIYSCHTPADSAPFGLSFELAKRLGLKDVHVLQPGKQVDTGLGIVGNLHEPMDIYNLIELVKHMCGSPVARCSGKITHGLIIDRIAIGSGACSDLIPVAIKAGAQVMITSDVKHNMFIDFNESIIVIDLGHYETEQCFKDIFYDIIIKKFPNFALYYSEVEKNPISYI